MRAQGTGGAASAAPLPRCADCGDSVEVYDLCVVDDGLVCTYCDTLREDYSTLARIEAQRSEEDGWL
jgi:hypothetical protein